MNQEIEKEVRDISDVERVLICSNELLKIHMVNTH